MKTMRNQQPGTSTPCEITIPINAQAMPGISNQPEKKIIADKMSAICPVFHLSAYIYIPTTHKTYREKPAITGTCCHIPIRLQEPHRSCRDDLNSTVTGPRVELISFIAPLHIR